MVRKMIAEEACKRAIEAGRGIEISDYCVGLKYSYVEVKGPKGRALGVAYVPYEDMYSGCVGKVPKLEDLLEMISGTNPIERSLSLAAVNAISQYLIWNSGRKYEAEFGDLIELTSKNVPSKAKILVIGNMGPLIRKLRSLGHEVKCLERSQRSRGSCLPDVYLKRLKGWPDAVIVTGTSLLNDTVDEIVETFQETFKGIVGPTAGCLPEVLLKYFDFVSSMRIREIDEAKRIIRLGGGRWAFTPYTDQYLFTSP